MKPLKLFIVFALMVFFSQFGHTQIEVGLIGGLNRSGLSGDKPKNASYTILTGFGFGGLVEINITHDVRFGIQPMYLQRGSKIAYKIPDVRDPVDSLNFKIDYFTLPLIFKVYASNQKTYLLSGVDVGFPLSASIEKLDGSDKEDVLDRLKSLDVAVNFGFGVRFPINQLFLAFELRYIQGLFNLNDPVESGENPLNFSISTTGFQLFSCISLPLGKP